MLMATMYCLDMRHSVHGQHASRQAFWPALPRNAVIKRQRNPDYVIKKRNLQVLNVAAPERDPTTLATEVDEIKQQLQTSPAIVVTFVATWCRKCIYLKPKLQKLMQEEFSNIPLLLVDVNAVSGDFIRTVEVTKMPTIQLWVAGRKVDERLGGHSGQEVIAEVRQMILQNTAGVNHSSNGQPQQ